MTTTATRMIVVFLHELRKFGQLKPLAHKLAAQASQTQQQQSLSAHAATTIKATRLFRPSVILETRSTQACPLIQDDYSEKLFWHFLKPNAVNQDASRVQAGSLSSKSTRIISQFPAESPEGINARIKLQPKPKAFSLKVLQHTPRNTDPYHPKLKPESINSTKTKPRNPQNRAERNP